MEGAWRNWSGSVVFRPREIARPRDTEALSLLVADSAARGEPVRVAGAGHSSNEILASDGRLVSLEEWPAPTARTCLPSRRAARTIAASSSSSRGCRNSSGR